MRRILQAVLGLAAVLLAATLPAPDAVSTAAVPTVGGCRVFPANNWWNTSVRTAPIDRRSATWLSHMSTGRDLHPDFGPSGSGAGYGIPITVAKASHATVPVSFLYAAESNRVRYPFGADTRVEGGRNSGSDMHVVVVDRAHCKLYETWDTRVSNNHWKAGSGAVWLLGSNALRPDGWTSADAAGLPILPGLLRWSEVKSGHVDHAIRFTTDITSAHHLWPARHDASSRTSLAYPPMGARFRLRWSYPETGYGTYARTVIHAMKVYGLVLADNGSPWYFQGERNAAWPPRLIAQLKRIPASRFVAVDTSGMKVSSGSAATR